MNYDEFLRRVPKAELHCRVEGSVRLKTAVDLAGKHQVELPVADAGQLYRFETFAEFAQIAVLVSSTLVDRDDFARIAYESLEDGVELGNLRVNAARSRGSADGRRRFASRTIDAPSMSAVACANGSAATFSLESLRREAEWRPHLAHPVDLDPLLRRSGRRRTAPEIRSSGSDTSYVAVAVRPSSTRSSPRGRGRRSVSPSRGSWRTGSSAVDAY